MTSEAAQIVKRSLSIAGHRTSISLEAAFWAALGALAAARGVSVPALVAEVDAGRGAANLSSALRVHLLAHGPDRGSLSDENRDLTARRPAQ